MKDLTLVALISGTLLFGCDIVKEPVPPGSSANVVIECTETQPLATTRRVLLEDFNGHRCNNCPAASEVAQYLDGIHGEELTVVGLHVLSNFAAPYPPLDDGKFDTDFRTDAGNIYAQDFGISFLPVGLVSRNEYGGFLLQSEGTWEAAVDAIIGQPADMDVQVNCLSFNSGTGTVEANINVFGINELNGEHALVVMLTEDHIIDWQLDARLPAPSEIADYEHRHVLRANLNGAFGEIIITGTFAAGDTLTRSFSYQLPASIINPNNCALVAYVRRTDTGEIMQVAERKFVP